MVHVRYYSKSNKSFDEPVSGLELPHTLLLVWALASSAIDFLPVSLLVAGLPRDSAHRSSKSDALEAGLGAGALAGARLA